MNDEIQGAAEPPVCAESDGLSVAEPEFVAQTLRWCNVHRSQQGKKPLKRLPKGQRMSGASCPCGAATGLHVGTHSVYVNGVAGAKLPSAVTAFVLAFDSGKLPQYEDAA